VVHLRINLRTNRAALTRLDADTQIRRILNQKALDVIGRWHFTPARRNGTLVASEIMAAFQFGSN
jgi:hypothetical protein